MWWSVGDGGFLGGKAIGEETYATDYILWIREMGFAVLAAVDFVA